MAARRHPEHLEPKQLRQIEDQLLRDRERTLRIIARVTAAMGVDPDGGSGLAGDAGDMSNDQTFREAESAAAARAGSTLREIDYALLRLRNDTEHFGVCEVTGSPIPFERLIVLPTARTLPGKEHELMRHGPEDSSGEE